MNRYFSFVTGFLAIGIELFVFLALMELPPFHKGDSDIIWGLPFFCLIVPGLTIPGIITAITLRKSPQGNSGVTVLGLVLNSLSLGIPFLLLRFGIIRAFL